MEKLTQCYISQKGNGIKIMWVQWREKYTLGFGDGLSSSQAAYQNFLSVTGGW